MDYDAVVAQTENERTGNDSIDMYGGWCRIPAYGHSCRFRCSLAESLFGLFDTFHVNTRSDNMLNNQHYYGKVSCNRKKKTLLIKIKMIETKELTTPLRRVGVVILQ